jgi:flotillin
VEAIRLKSDQVLPAEAQLKAQEFRARGDASIIREKGQAMSEALSTLNAAWKEAGDSALSIFLIEDLEKILAAAAEGAKKVKIDSLQMIDGGDGKVLSGYIQAYPEMLKSMFNAVESTTGINIPRAIGGTKEETQ